jgi:hypothetical protein
MASMTSTSNLKDRKFCLLIRILLLSKTQNGKMGFSPCLKTHEFGVSVGSAGGWQFPAKSAIITSFSNGLYPLLKGN